VALDAAAALLLAFHADLGGEHFRRPAAAVHIEAAGRFLAVAARSAAVVR